MSQGLSRIAKTRFTCGLWLTVSADTHYSSLCERRWFTFSSTAINAFNEHVNLLVLIRDP